MNQEALGPRAPELDDSDWIEFVGVAGLTRSKEV